MAQSTGAVPVQAASVVRRSFPLKQASIGTVQTMRTVAVKSQVDGVIQTIHFKEGDDVKAGDLLVTLDQRPFVNALRIAKADLADAQAQAEEAAADATRYKRLDQKDAVSKELYTQYMTKVETTRALVQSKEAAVANAELQFSYTEIRAPISGRTGQLNLHEGALIKANDSAATLVTINQIAPITVAYAVPEDALDSLRAALHAGPVPVKAITHESPARTSTGQLGFLDNAIDPSTGMILLKANFANADGTLWPGESVDVETQLGLDKNVLLVPSNAVQTGQNGSQVYVIKPDNTVDLRPVQTGRSADGFTIVRSGLDEGDTVVTDGQLRLVPGVHVKQTTLDAIATAAGATSHS